jgi:hypothetical protein
MAGAVLALVVPEHIEVVTEADPDELTPGLRA